MKLGPNKMPLFTFGKCAPFINAKHRQEITKLGNGLEF